MQMKALPFLYVYIVSEMEREGLKRTSRFESFFHINLFSTQNVIQIFNDENKLWIFLSLLFLCLFKFFFSRSFYLTLHSAFHFWTHFSTQSIQLFATTLLHSHIYMWIFRAFSFFSAHVLACLLVVVYFMAYLFLQL